MKLGKLRIPKVMVPSAPKHIREEIQRYDREIRLLFNRTNGQWELYRRGHYLFGTSRLDGRIKGWLWEHDIINRYGSIENYEQTKYDEFQRLKQQQQDEMKHTQKWWIKDNKQNWQVAFDNAKAGRLAPNPQTTKRKVIHHA